MVNSWLIVKADFSDMDALKIVRDFVKPVIEKFESKLSTFHFFFEPYLLFRMKARALNSGSENEGVQRRRPENGSTAFPESSALATLPLKTESASIPPATFNM
jgi:hypothetical protein